MKSESTVKPVALYEIELAGETARITFCENVTQKAVGEGEVEKWEYDTYCINVRNRDNLTASVDAKMAEWLQAAKDSEIVPVLVPTEKERLASMEDMVMMLLMPPM